MKEEPRFDVLWKEHWPSLDYHFCRGWEFDPTTGKEVGCYGTNPDHGYSWEEAKAEMVRWHEEEAERWRKKTLTEWRHVETEEPAHED